MLASECTVNNVHDEAPPNILVQPDKHQQEKCVSMWTLCILAENLWTHSKFYRINLVDYGCVWCFCSRRDVVTLLFDNVIKLHKTRIEWREPLLDEIFNDDIMLVELNDITYWPVFGGVIWMLYTIMRVTFSLKIENDFSRDMMVMMRSVPVTFASIFVRTICLRSQLQRRKILFKFSHIFSSKINPFWSHIISDYTRKITVIITMIVHEIITTYWRAHQPSTAATTAAYLCGLLRFLFYLMMNDVWFITNFVH